MIGTQQDWPPRCERRIRRGGCPRSREKKARQGECDQFCQTLLMGCVREGLKKTTGLSLEEVTGDPERWSFSGVEGQSLMKVSARQGELSKTGGGKDGDVFKEFLYHQGFTFP